MPVDASPHATWTALEVSDHVLYANYREGMAPILARHGGVFLHDFSVSRVLRSSAGPRTNRVFAIAFPDAGAEERFYADPAYQMVRRERFDPSVIAVTRL